MVVAGVTDGGRAIAETLGGYFLAAGARAQTSAENWRWAYLRRDLYPEAIWVACEDLAALCRADATRKRPAIEEHLVDIWSLGMDLALSQGESMQTICDALLFELQSSFEEGAAPADAGAYIGALMPGSGRYEDMWRGRGIALLQAVLEGLWRRRSNGDGAAPITAATVREAVGLEALTATDDAAVQRLLAEFPEEPKSRATQHYFVVTQILQALDLIENAPPVTKPDRLMTLLEAEEALTRLGCHMLETRTFETAVFLSLLRPLRVSVWEFLGCFHKTKKMHGGFRVRPGDARDTLSAERPPRALVMALDTLHLPMVQLLSGVASTGRQRRELHLLGALFGIGRRRLLARHRARQRGEQLTRSALEAEPGSLAAVVAMRKALWLQGRGHVRWYEAVALRYLQRRLLARAPALHPHS